MMGGYGAIYRWGNGIFFVSLTEDDVPSALSLDIDDDAPKWDDVFKGIVRRRDGRMGFVDVGSGPPAMTILSTKSDAYEGSHVRVRITREGFAAKPPECVVLESCAQDSEALGPILRAESYLFRALRAAHQTSVPLTIYDRDLFENVCIFLNKNALIDAWAPLLKTTENPPAAILAVFDDLLTPCVPLKNGGSLIVEEGETLTAIDVNTSGPTGAHPPLKNKQDILLFNQKVLPDIAHQIQIRDLSGALFIDLIRMGDAKSRLAVLESAQKLFAPDPRIQVLGWTRGGFFELTRRRDRSSLTRLYSALKRNLS